MGEGQSKFGFGSSIRYKVYVKTGDRIGMGTDNDVFVALIDEHGLRTRDFKLDRRLKNDLERGALDQFTISVKDGDFGRPEYVELRRSRSLVLDDDWYCEYVKLVCLSREEVYTFPVHRWILSGSPMKFKEYDMVLSQDEELRFQRREELQRKKIMYEAVKHKQTQMLMCRTLPNDESFSNESMFDLASTALKIMVWSGALEVTADKFETLRDIEKVYQEPYLPVPAGLEKWDSDKEFGYQRLTGCNPNQIRLCTELPKNFAVTEAELNPHLEGLTIDEALGKKRLFIVNHEFLRDLPCTDGRKICAPMALFFVNEQKNLMPVAIQLFPDPATDNPVFYPSDPKYTWLLAKCYFNNADASVHESATHLGFTHLLGEAVAIATNRSLSPSHPIYRLLAPHFLYLLAINNRAVSSLVTEGGWVDQTMAIGRIGMFDIVRRKWETWRLDVEGSLLGDLEERGVADPEVLPNYHYRDDALLVRRAIYDYVKRIVDGHYKSDKSVSGDTEIQEWGRILSGKDISPFEKTVGMKGMPNDGQFKTRDEISETVANFIFICSVGHAAVNFGQYDQFGFPPCYPAWMHGEPPRNKEPLDEGDLLAQLPDKKETLSAMTITKILSTRGTNSLGYFEVQYIHDPVGLDSLEKFRADLKKIGGIIDQRNEKREEQYIYLHPREIPNAISI